MREEVITAFVTLFVVVDPLGLAPVFISLTRGLGGERRQIAVQASLIAFAVLAGAALIGDWLLRTLGIGLPAFRIAGGLLLFAIAFEQVFGRRQERKLEETPPGAEAVMRPAAPTSAGASIAAFPLAIPLMAGPGAIAACVLLAEHTGGDPRRMALLFLIIAAVVTSCYAAFLASPQLERVLGEKGEIVFARLLGVLLAALAVQYVVDGVLAVHGG
jgi:multiple antibiotic resistance protein